MKYLIIGLFSAFFFNAYAQHKTDSVQMGPSKIESKILALTDSVISLRKDLNDFRKSNLKSPMERFSSEWIPVISLLMTLGAVIFAYYSIRQNRRLKLSELAFNLATEFANKEMNESLRAVREFANKFPDEDDRKNEFTKLNEENFPSISDLNNSRRKVSHYFHKIFLLTRYNAITEDEMMHMVEWGQIEALELIKPMEEAINPDGYDLYMYRYFASIKKKLELIEHKMRREI